VQTMRHAREASVFSKKSERALCLCLVLSLLSSCAAGEKDALRADERIVIVPREIEELDPRFVGDAYGLKLSRMLYASLVTIDPRTLSPRPDLAEDVSMEDALHYRVRLKPGLRFADGSALDADDVVATFRAIADAKVASRYRSSYARIAEVSAEDPQTVRFTLSEPHATLMTDLELPVLREEDAFRPRSRGVLPVASGRYVLSARAQGGLTLVPNRQHHAPPKHRYALRFVVVRDDNVRALRMLAGAGDLAQNVLPPLLLPMFAGLPGLRVQSTRGAGTTYVGINLTHPVLRDVRVRRAIAHAIDRAAIVRHKLDGRATLANSWLPEGHWASAADTPRYEYDPARARDLLRERAQDAAPLRLILRTSSDRNVISLGRALASMLAAVGIELSVRPSENATLLSDLARGRFELTLMQVPEVFEPNVLNWFFASDRIPEPGVREGGNRFRMRDVALDQALEEGRREHDLTRRKAAYRSVQHILARELPVIPLWHEDVVSVVSARLGGYEVPRDARFGTLAE
jgi:peptide/nickel transport system substrate-binding protein